MTNQYSITIKNESNYAISFVLFLNVSPPTNGPPEDEVFNAVYASSPRVVSGDDSQVTFTMQPEFFAVCGTTPAPLQSGTVLPVGSSVPIEIGLKCGTLARMTAPEGNPQWMNDKFSKISIPGGFAIRTDTSFKYPNPENIFIGLGARDSADATSIIPVQTFLARPNLLTAFYPCIRYILTTGDYKPGTIVDKTQIGAVLEVDFEKTNMLRNLVFTYNNQGEYVPDEQTKEAGGFVSRNLDEVVEERSEVVVFQTDLKEKSVAVS